MSRTAPSPSLRHPQPLTPARDRLKRLVTRAAITASSFAFAGGLIVPIKYPEALGE